MAVSKNKILKFGSLFAGVGGFDLGFERSGMECLWQVENDPYCNKVLERHWKDVRRYEDVNEVGKQNLEPVELICGGFPCFPADTLILTSDGYKPIQHISVGDFVYTHNKRLRQVTDVMNQWVDELVSLVGRGNNKITTTAEHPFYSSIRKTAYKKGVPVHSFSDRKWTNAQEMNGKHWISPCSFGETSIPEIEIKNVGEFVPCEFTKEFFWFVGLWLGDGWIRRHKRYGRNTKETNGQVYVCANYKQKEYIISMLEEIGFHFTVTNDRTVAKLIITNKALARWLSKHFGEGASKKTLPYWVLGIKKEYRQALLDGYVFADGNVRENGFRITTISKKLAHSTKLLAQSIGKSASVLGFEVPKTTTIESRVVNQNKQYQVYAYDKPTTTHFIDGFAYGKVRKVKYEKRRTKVYNIGVWEDESYVADGLVVHNCQDLSIAGKRAGFDGKRSALWFEFERIIAEMQSKWVVIENVPGLLSSRKGEDFEVILRSLDELGYGVAWRILDSQYFGVPQRRRRVFIVASLGDPSCGQVLFECEGMSRNFEESQREGAGTPPTPSKKIRRRDKKTDVDPLNERDLKKILAMASGQANAEIVENKSPTLTLLHEQPIIWEMHHSSEVYRESKGGIVPTLQARMGTGGNQIPLMGIRRLTPTECCRLQGFPDDWNDNVSDTQRYKQMGNAVTVNVIEWIGKRITEVENCHSN